jgi:hypothetical protein
LYLRGKRGVSGVLARKTEQRSPRPKQYAAAGEAQSSEHYDETTALRSGAVNEKQGWRAQDKKESHVQSGQIHDGRRLVEAIYDEVLLRLELQLLLGESLASRQVDDNGPLERAGVVAKHGLDLFHRSRPSASISLFRVCRVRRCNRSSWAPKNNSYQQQDALLPSRDTYERGFCMIRR